MSAEAILFFALILIAGGLFLVWKATKEIHHNVDPDPGPDFMSPAAATVTMGAVITQILILDLVFSIDSIITAVGMTEHVPIMAELQWRGVLREPPLRPSYLNEPEAMERLQTQLAKFDSNREFIEMIARKAAFVA